MEHSVLRQTPEGEHFVRPVLAHRHRTATHTHVHAPAFLDVTFLLLLSPWGQYDMVKSLSITQNAD